MLISIIQWFSRRQHICDLTGSVVCCVVPTWEQQWLILRSIVLVHKPYQLHFVLLIHTFLSSKFCFHNQAVCHNQQAGHQMRCSDGVSCSNYLQPVNECLLWNSHCSSVCIGWCCPELNSKGLSSSLHLSCCIASLPLVTTVSVWCGYFSSPSVVSGFNKTGLRWLSLGNTDVLPSTS